MKWDQNNPEKVKDFIAKMKQDYAFKKAYAARRAWEFYNHPDVAGMCYVAVGGLDSITLFLFLRSIGIEVPGTSVSMLEDRSIQKVHKALGIRALRPANGPKDRPYTKIEVIREHGFPVLSKEIAGKISLLQHPSEKNATVRHAIMLDLAGICVSAGSACTSGSGEPSHVLTAMGLSRRDAYGAIRITLGEENTTQEVDYIAATIKNIVADLRKETRP